VHVLDLAMRRPTLDDVFLQLTGHHAEAESSSATDDAPAAAPKGASR
jgi:ABC-2 type transport system ATP-binding protein